MLKSLAIPVLNSLLADYVEGSFEEKLVSFSLSGKMELKELELKVVPSPLSLFHCPRSPLMIKRTILDQYNMGFTLTRGVASRITLDGIFTQSYWNSPSVPWTDLSKKATKLTLDGVYLLVKPRSLSERDPREQERIKHYKKMKKVEMAEAMRKSSGDLVGISISSGSPLIIR